MSYLFRHSFPCAVVYYSNPPYEQIQFKWLKDLPGSFSNSVHLLFVNELPAIERLRRTKGVRIIFNQIFITNRNPCMQTFTTDLNCNKFLELGKICHNGEYLWNRNPKPILWNKWINFKRKSFKFANANETARKVKIDCKLVSDTLEKPFNLLSNNELGNIVLDFIMCTYGEGINATTIRNDVPVPFMDITEYAPGSFYGLAYEVVLGRSHALFGLGFNPKHSNFLELAKVGIFDSFTFMTALPTMDNNGSIWFIFRTFDFFIWMLLLLSSILQVVVLAMLRCEWKGGNVLNGNALNYAINTIFKPILDQPVGITDNNVSVQNWRVRIVSGIWFLSTILIVNMFRSKLTSSMVMPLMTLPPRNMAQLLKSDYKVNTFLYEETEFKDALDGLVEQGSTIAKQLNQTFDKHYNGIDMHKV